MARFALVQVIDHDIELNHDPSKLVADVAAMRSMTSNHFLQIASLSSSRPWPSQAATNSRKRASCSRPRATIGSGGLPACPADGARARADVAAVARRIDRRERALMPSPAGRTKPTRLVLPSPIRGHPSKLQSFAWAIWIICRAISSGERTKSIHPLAMALLGMSGAPAVSIFWAIVIPPTSLIPHSAAAPSPS
jgi:hypothetical protein